MFRKIHSKKNTLKKRDKLFTMKLSVSEYGRFLRLAMENTDGNMSEWIREAALNYERPVREEDFKVKRRSKKRKPS